MPTFRVAAVREQNVDLIIVEVDRAFGDKTSAEQEQVIQALQIHAKAAGLVGSVVPVWAGADGDMKSKAPSEWRPFFRNLTSDWFVRKINKQLRW